MPVLLCARCNAETLSSQRSGSRLSCSDVSRTYESLNKRDARAATVRAPTGGDIRTKGASVKVTTAFSSLLETFFMERLIHQRNASPHTVTSYRDTFRLLMQYSGSTTFFGCSGELCKPSRICLTRPREHFSARVISRISRPAASSRSISLYRSTVNVLRDIAPLLLVSPRD